MLLDSYCTERSTAGPSGENLEYDPEYIALFLAAQPKEERQAGKEIIPGEDPNFKDVVQKALGVLEQSHDLRVAAVLAVAQISLGGFEGLVGPVSYMRTCLEKFWDTCHPMLDADDDNDPTMRINSVSGIASADMLRRLRLAPLTESMTFGRMNLRDVAMIEGEIPPPPGMSNLPDKAKLSAAFMDTKPDLLKTRLAALRQLIADVGAIVSVFDARTDSASPDLDPVVRLLKRASKLIADAIGEPEVEIVMADEAAQATMPVAASVAVPSAITTAADVRMTLDRIIEFYVKYEPSSPLPLLLLRARRLVGADFMTILTDLAPSGIDSVKTISGAREAD